MLRRWLISLSGCAPETPMQRIGAVAVAVFELPVFAIVIGLIRTEIAKPWTFPGVAAR
ncbi:MAG: hypothetical protein AAF667_11445 [Pseudomonadota bacterium]